MKPIHWVILAFIVLAVSGGAALTGTLPGDGTIPDIVQTFSEAIAFAEGFYISGSRAQRNNNPGNIRSDGKNFDQYETVGDGWQALYNQVYKMFFGGSKYYNPSQTIAEIGWIYADGQNDPIGASNWAANVSSKLGVTTDTTLQSLMA